MRRSIVVITVVAALARATAGHGQAEADSTAATADTAAVRTDSLRTITVTDSLGIRGTLRGQSDYDPLEMKETLRRMGSSEVAGATTWERKKNPRTALICSALLPGLGQTYNGRRLKVGLMVGFMSYYVGNMILDWRRYQDYSLQADEAPPGSVAQRQAAQLADFYKEGARTYLWWSGAAWLIGLLDSWIDAHLYDVRAYTPPPPPKDGVPQAGAGETSYITVGIGLSFE